MILFSTLFYKLMKCKQKRALEEAKPETDLEKEYCEYKKYKELEIKAIKR